jgi:hypothetical protein
LDKIYRSFWKDAYLASITNKEILPKDRVKTANQAVSDLRDHNKKITEEQQLDAKIKKQRKEVDVQGPPDSTAIKTK